MIIEVCGKGCPKCEVTEQNIVTAMKELGLNPGIDAVVTKIKDPKMMAARGVMFTPAVLINGVKVSEGKIPDVKEAKKWLEGKCLK